jgi:membrane protease YdiL (CAAX protease family)
MAHSAWWVGALQVALLFAALVFGTLARDDEQVPDAESLPRGVRIKAAIKLHPRQYGASVLCVIGATACSILYYF